MSTDFNCVDDKNKVWWHLGQRMAGSYSFGYGENDKNGIFHAAEFICDRLEYGQSLRIVLTDDIPEDYEEIDIDYSEEEYQDMKKEMNKLSERYHNELKFKDIVIPCRNFRPGDTVVFDPTSFNPDFWNGLSEQEKLTYYGPLGYGSKKPVLFTFICEMKPQYGHCVLLNISTGKIETMRHTSDFRIATENEC